MADEQDELPAVIILSFSAPCGHSREADAVVNHIVKFSVAFRLSCCKSHIGDSGAEVPPQPSIAAAVVRVATRTVIGKVFPRLLEDRLIRGKRIDLRSFVSWHCRGAQGRRDSWFTRA